MSKRAFFAWFALVTVLLFASTSRAAPTSHILRIDPRAGLSDGQPVLTSVIEIVQFTSMSEVVTNKGCGQLKGDPLLDCISAAVEDKGALWKAFPFPEQGAALLVRVGDNESPAKFVSKTSWASASKDPLVGTAWLIALDASSMMGPRYADAREVANQFLGSLGPNDIAKLIIFDDRVNAYTATSQWVPASQKAQLISILQANASPAPSHGRGRPFSNQIKQITKAFGDIGNSGSIQHVPMHQAMVVLSNGAGREDVNSPAAAAEVMKQYFNKGRFPEDNPLAPKTPLPVISIYFPAGRGFTNDLYASNDLQFMQDLSNPEIGGFFDIVRQGQGYEKAKTILSLVKSRFNLMWVVKWRLSCLSSTPEQSFNLLFRGVQPQIIPDGSFKEVPIGVDPTTWPLDINVAQTKAEADANPIFPGGRMRIYGDFCWGGDKARAEAYFVPAGTKPDPNVNRNDPAVARRAMQSLIAQNMRGAAVDTADTFVEFEVPSEDKILEGTGDNMITRLVVYDNKAHRASGYDEKTVLTLKATKRPFPLPLVLGIAGLVVVVVLLVVILLRGGGGGGKGKRSNQPPPAPVVAGGGGVPPYGAPPGAGGVPPYGGGYPPAGGGYGASNAAAFAPAMHDPSPSPPARPEGGGHPLAGGAPGVVQVRCPSCNMLTMAMPGQAAVCFSCGQPLPKDIGSVDASSYAQGGAAPFPLTGGMPAKLEPPANPYAAAGGATILGAAGQFAIRGGVEVRVGRDPAQCPITLAEPRVSGVHATLKFEDGRLMVRDETSNNGTYVDGARIAHATWTHVAGGALLRFGPVEFSVRID